MKTKPHQKRGQNSSTTQSLNKNNTKKNEKNKPDTIEEHPVEHTTNNQNKHQPLEK
jgi:hypothetical protein